MAIGKFNKGSATTAPARPAPKPVQRQSPYANVEEQGDRDPMPVPGRYVFRVIDCVNEPSPKNKTIWWFKVRLEIVALEGPQAEQAHKVGDIVAMIQQTAGNGADQGVPRVVSFVRNAAGYEDKDEYRAYNPEGYFEEAQHGLVNEYSERGEFIAGRLVYAEVTRGRDTKDGGDYYRNYSWAVVPDEAPEGEISQDQVGKVGAS